MRSLNKRERSNIVHNSGKMRILFCEAGHNGGSVKRLTQFLRNVNSDLIQPFLLTYYKNGKAGELLALQGITAKRHLDLVQGPTPDVLRQILKIPVPTIFGLRYFKEAFKIVLFFRPDLIYLNNTPFCHLPMIIAARLMRIPMICHMRDSIKLTRSELWALSCIDKIVTLSLSHKDFYRDQGIPVEKMTVIYNGIDLGQFDKASHDSINVALNDQTVACVGSLTSRKRQVDAILALEILKKEFPKLKMLFLGNGSDREFLETLIRNKGLEKNALIHGLVTNVAPYLRRCKIGIMLSDREGIPNVILEYMAAGLPVITTDLPGIREIVTDGVTGHVVKVGDPDSVATEIKKFLVDTNECKRMGLLGREVLEKGNFNVKTEFELIWRLLEGTS